MLEAILQWIRDIWAQPGMPNRKAGIATVPRDPSGRVVHGQWSLGKQVSSGKAVLLHHELLPVEVGIDIVQWMHKHLTFRGNKQKLEWSCCLLFAEDRVDEEEVARQEAAQLAEEEKKRQRHEKALSDLQRKIAAPASSKLASRSTVFTPSSRSTASNSTREPKIKIEKNITPKTTNKKESQRANVDNETSSASIRHEKTPKKRCTKNSMGLIEGRASETDEVRLRQVDEQAIQDELESLAADMAVSPSVLLSS
jgi:hypothetical protein